MTQSPKVTPLSRRARKKAVTRREIYRAAMRLFHERGFDSVSIEAICEEADVARRTFFLHFPTKAHLLHEFNREVAEDFGARLQEPRASAREELEDLIEMLGQRLLAEAEVMGAMLREHFSRSLADQAREAAEDAIHEQLLGIIERGQARGEFRAALRPSLAVVTILATASAILSGMVFPLDTPPDEVRRQFLEIVLRGIEPPRTS